MAEQSKDDVLSVITQIVSEESGVAAKDITRDTTFAQDLDVDSLGLLTIATQVEERFAGQDVPRPDFWGGWRIVCDGWMKVRPT